MKALSLLGALGAILLCACSVPFPQLHSFKPNVRLSGLRDDVLAWHVPPPVEQVRGLRLLSDAPRPASVTLAVVHFIVRANPRLSPPDALMLASAAVGRAHEVGLDPAFFCATLLQESAFDPDAVSGAAAVGIAQFTLDTAAAYGVNPFDWNDALRGAALLLSAYTETYSHAAQDRYVLALAAYNAGPGAVDRYGGVPPYPETREYITDIIDRWARILAWER
jgi:soluble lytic murein transglycosylase-like protein